MDRLTRPQLGFVCGAGQLGFTQRIVESFTGKLRDELLDGGIFYTRQVAKILIERWIQQYSRFGPRGGRSDTGLWDQKRSKSDHLE